MADIIAKLNEQFLECDICYERYNDTTNVPLILRCNHTICGACMKKLIKLNAISCPLCNGMHHLSYNGIEGLQKDNTRRDLLLFIAQCMVNMPSVQVTKQPSKQIHKLVNTDDTFTKSTFVNLLSQFSKKTSSITRIRTELLSNIQVLTQRQEIFTIAFEDLYREGDNDLNKCEDTLLKKYDDACKIERNIALMKAVNLDYFIDNALDYTCSLLERLVSQPYLVDESIEKYKIQEFLEYKYDSQTQNSALNDIETDLISFYESEIVLKENSYYVRFKRTTVQRLCSCLKSLYMSKYTTASVIVVTLLLMSLLSFHSADQEFNFSRSDQFPCSVGNDNTTGLWSSEHFCGTQMKLVRYDGIPGYTRSSNFTRYLRLQMKVTLSRKGFDNFSSNQTLLEVDLISYNVSHKYTYEHAHKMWTLKTYTCTNKYSICMKTKLQHLLHTYLYFDSSQSILTGKFIILLNYDCNYGTHILLKSGNHTVIAEDTMPSVNLQPVFTVYQSDTVSVTLSINSFEKFNDYTQFSQNEQYTTGHKIISNTPAWPQNTLNYTVPYLFASTENQLIEHQNEISTAIDIMYSLPRQIDNRSTLFDLEFGRVINGTLFPIVQLEVSICQQDVSHTIGPPLLFCLNDTGNSAYSRTLDQSMITLNIYFNFLSGELHLSDTIQEGEVYVFKYDLHNRTHCAPYFAVEHISAFNIAVIYITEKISYMQRFMLLISDIVTLLLDSLKKIVYAFLRSFAECISFLYGVLSFITEKITAFVCLLYWVLFFIIGNITEFVYSLYMYGVLMFKIEKITAFINLLYRVLLFFIETIGLILIPFALLFNIKPPDMRSDNDYAVALVTGVIIVIIYRIIVCWLI